MAISGYKDQIISALEDILATGDATAEGIYSALETQGFIEESADEMPMGEEYGEDEEAEGAEEGGVGMYEEGMEAEGAGGTSPLGSEEGSEEGPADMPADTRIMAVRAALSDDADKKKKAAEARTL